MPTDRLLRFTIAGSTLLTSLIFFFLVFGGDIQTVIGFFGSGEYLFKIVALILGTPTIGILVSLIGFEFLVLFKDYEVYYYVPKDENLIKWILEEQETTTDLGKKLRENLNRAI